MRPEIALYYYATQIVLVDDNLKFLTALEQVLNLANPDLEYTSFHIPQQALEEINENYRLQLQQQTVSQGTDDEEIVSQFILETLNKGSEISSSTNRNKEISVVIIDLDMPNIDGIEFCRQIKNPNIKKILLTGIATPTRVIEAFNNADIHFYVNKSEENMDRSLSEAINRLQYEYFLDMSSKVTSEAIVGSAPILSDPALANYFEQLSNSLNVLEFYYQPYPSRYNLKLPDDQKSLLLVYTEYEIKQHIKVLEEEDAPGYLMESLETGEYIPHFTTADGFYEADHPDASLWVTHKADIIVGKQKYLCGVIDANIPETPMPSVTPITPGKTLH